MSDAFDARTFRDVLGHFPTGVVVITAMDAADEPLSMVVGSFTSVSLDPPLVAFLPSQTSSSYQRMREATSFCVNVLSENQEEVSRKLASRDARKFDGLAWRRSPAGNPILEGAVAWIDCDLFTRHAAGDHDIVIGTVTGLDTQTSAGPLLFFQGGYGRFDRQQGSDPLGLSRQLQAADATRFRLQTLADETGLEAYTQHVVDGDLMILAATAPAGRPQRAHIGRRLPLRMPYGATFPAFDQSLVPAWSPREETERAELSLERVRTRGCSIGLVAQDHDVHWATISDHGHLQGAAAVDDRIVEALGSIAGAYEPSDEVLRCGAIDVRIISAPVLDAEGSVIESIALFGFEPGATAAQVDSWVDALLAAARSAADDIASMRDQSISR